MFPLLGKLIVRFWPIILALWGVAVVAGFTLAPAWDKVAKNGEVDFLPPSAPSRIADGLFKEAFPLEFSAGNIALILARDGGELEERDRAFIKNELVPGLGKIEGEENSPINAKHTLNDERVGALLVSPDKKATIIFLELTTPFQDQRNIPVVAAIETLIADLQKAGKVPAGLAIGVAGSATAGRDLDLAEAASARTIERWTIGIVVALLLFLYRAPLVAFIPLLTVAVAVEVSMRFLAWLAFTLPPDVFAPSRDLRIFVTVLAYGAGVDYCLFLIARYREELEEGKPAIEALEHTITRVGAAITASAATVICGIGMLAFAKFGKIHEAGIVIPLALSVALLSTLTFASSLLRLTGHWAFWPNTVVLHSQAASLPRWRRWLLSGVNLPNIWDRIGPILVARPASIFVLANLLLAPFAILGVIHAHDQNFSPLADLPANAPSRVGTRLMQKHFATGVLGPVTVLVKNDAIDFANPKSMPLIEELVKNLRSSSGDLGIEDIRSLADPLGYSPAAKAKLASFRTSKEEVDKLVRDEGLRYYVSETSAGRVMRLDITLADDPLNKGGIAGLGRIEHAIAGLLPAGLRGSRVEFAGSTASLRDLSVIKQGDQELIQVLVSGVVMLLLLIILRRFVVSAYLILSVLLSYLATLGLTDLVFRQLGGEEFIGLDWKVPIFLFTILVAVGEDYNIFLLTRVKEEQDTFGPRDAIPHALSRTGQVISSCGFIMAGTFASLLSSPLAAMKQLGFALAVGVLIDTLIVRPILVPTFLVLVQNLIPGRVGAFLALGHWKPSQPTNTGRRP